jgi:hypothetical protein
MSAKDRLHDVVKSVLQKDGWTITDDPLTLRADSFTDLFIDLGAEKLLAAERGDQRIAVEVKSFLGQSAVNEFHAAVGQFINYRYALADLEPERSLYLAISLNIYNDFFTRPFIQSVVERSEIKLLVYNVEKEEVVQWQG